MLKLTTSFTALIFFLFAALLFVCKVVQCQYIHPPKTITALNGSELLLKCPPAEMLVRTHMAPDFENPQLVRRLDWFHDDLLVASYQQDSIVDSNRQWWVASKRYELVKPFYELQIEPLMPEDSGTYRCRLETDPLFALDTSTHTVGVIAIVKPFAPSKPQVTSYTENTVTLTWSHNTAEAHRPILRYSIFISQMDAENIKVISTKGNSTTFAVTGLQPYTRYAFSVRAENVAGSSNFGPEMIFRTLGEAPSMPPVIASVANGTDGCVDVEWRSPTITNGQIVGYRIMVYKIADTAMREWYWKGNKRSLCFLDHFSEYVISVEADNGFGYSPKATARFKTPQRAPSGPPEMISVKPLRSDAILISWQEPRDPNGVIIAYNIYYKETRSHQTFPKIPMLVRPQETSKSFSYNMTKLKPHTEYKIYLSASTAEGEGPKSSAVEVKTDYAIPDIPQITNITYKCHGDVTIYWTPLSSHVSFFRILIQAAGQPAAYNSTAPHISLSGLDPIHRYTVQVSSVLRSSYDNNTFLESDFSASEVFQLDDKCYIQSSICSSFNHNCIPISVQATATEHGNSLSFTLIFFSAVFLIFCSIFFLCIIKKQCVFVKQYLKKTDQKYPQETMSLVYEVHENATGETVTIDHYEKYYEECSANDHRIFRQQFEEIEADTTDKEQTEEQLNDNRTKNRYVNISAIESTRIRINNNDTPDSDYINANYVDSCDCKNAYIATQAPLPHTFTDFWTMIAQERCNIIVVITNMIERGKRKCDQYWPSTVQSSAVFGQWQVTLGAEMPNSAFVHRILYLKNTSGSMSERTIHQVHFMSWPDHGVPSTAFSLLSFMNYVSEIQSTGPIVIHCSAGVGRSGSYILIDSMRRHLLLCDRINILAHLKHIRRQRTKLVQTVEQYIFCHVVIRELIRHGISRQPILNFNYYVNFLHSQRIPDGRTRLQLQYDDVCKCPHQPQCEIPTGAVVLPGYHRTNEFIVANWSSACAELWNTLWEHNCQTVLLIGSDLEIGDYFNDCNKARAASSSEDEIRVEQRDDRFMLNKNNDELCIKLIRVKPTALELDFWSEMERIQDEILQYHNCQMLLIDPSTSSISYILCALQSAACQMEQERYIDILPYISNYRYIRCGCWRSLTNLEYIYDKLTQLAMLQKRH